MMARNPLPASNRLGRGFTFVEMLVVAVLVLVIGGGLLTSFLVGQKSFLSSDATALIQQQARQAFDTMVRELRESDTMSCGEAGTTANCTSNRLNFQIVRSYDTATDTVQLGSDVAANEFIHYLITVAGLSGQLVRCRSGAATTPTANFGDFSACRVLANYVDGGVGASSFSWDSVAQVVTLNLEIEYRSTALPTGGQTTGVLTSRVRLRNL